MASTAKTSGTSNIDRAKLPPFFFIVVAVEDAEPMLEEAINGVSRATDCSDVAVAPTHPNPPDDDTDDAPRPLAAANEFRVDEFPGWTPRL